jgi:hypothetical protein
MTSAICRLPPPPPPPPSIWRHLDLLRVTGTIAITHMKWYDMIWHLYFYTKSIQNYKYMRLSWRHAFNKYKIYKYYEPFQSVSKCRVWADFFTFKFKSAWCFKQFDNVCNFNNNGFRHSFPYITAILRYCMLFMKFIKLTF